MVLFWWFFVVVFIVTYTASLTNLLRRGPWSNVAKGYTKIHSLKDLAMQSSVEFGVIAKGSTSDYLQQSHLAHLQRLWQQISSNKADYLFDSIEEGIQKVRNSPKANFAFITEMALAKYFVYQPPCDLSFVSDISIATKSFSFAFDKQFPYLDEIDMAILKLKENDYLQFLDATWFQGGCVEETSESPREDWSKSLQYTPIDLGYFSGALILLLIGLMLGGAISVVEVIIFKFAESVRTIAKRNFIYSQRINRLTERVRFSSVVTQFT